MHMKSLPKVKYLAVFRLNYPYLSIFALNCLDLTMCAIFTLYMYYYIETSAQSLRVFEPLFMEILHFQRIGGYLTPVLHFKAIGHICITRFGGYKSVVNGWVLL